MKSEKHHERRSVSLARETPEDTTSVPQPPSAKDVNKTREESLAKRSRAQVLEPKHNEHVVSEAEGSSANEKHHKEEKHEPLAPNKDHKETANDKDSTAKTDTDHKEPATDNPIKDHGQHEAVNEPAKEQAKEPAKQPAKEQGTEPSKDPAKEPAKDPAKEPAKDGKAEETSAEKEKRKAEEAAVVLAKSGKMVSLVTGWSMTTFDRKDVAKSMVGLACNRISEKGSKLPQGWDGIWWQDGVPSTEMANTWAQAVWTPGADACRKSTIWYYSEEERAKGVVQGPYNDTVPCQGRMTFFAYDHRNWAYNTANEAVARSSALLGRMNFDMVCGGADKNHLTICKMNMELPSKGQQSRAAIFSDLFPLEWSMVKVTDDMWVRYSKFPGVDKEGKIAFHKYYYKKITDCHGKPGKYWDEFVSGGKRAGSGEPEKDVFGGRLNLNNRTSSEVPSKIYIRAHRQTDKDSPITIG